MYNRVVELVFDMGGTELPIVQAAQRGGFEIELQETHHRSDGLTLEYYSVPGVSADRATEVFGPIVDPFALEVCSSGDYWTVLEVLVEQSVATTLADERSRLSRFTATPEACELVAHAPEHVEASLVSATVRRAHPGAELLARRRRLAEDVSLEDRRFAAVVEELTDRQYAALEAATEAGYFAIPREATCGEIATTLGIADSTFSEHLRAAQRTVFDHLFADR